MFGCAWKINFSENIFSWLCVLIALTWKLVLVKIFTSNHFWTHVQREREREREREPRSCLQRRSCLWLRWSTNRFTNPRIDHRSRAFNPQALDFAGNPEPLRHEPTNWSLCVILIFCVILIDPRTDLRFCDFEFLLSLFDLWFFLLLLWSCGWWCFGGFPVVWWWVLCGWWWKIAFSKYYQTHENIF